MSYEQDLENRIEVLEEKLRTCKQDVLEDLIIALEDWEPLYDEYIDKEALVYYIKNKDTGFK